MFHSKNMRKIMALSAALSLFSPSCNLAHAGDENIIPEAFRGDTPDSQLTIDYTDLTAILNQTVWETGHSDRSNAGKVAARPGSRIARGNRSATRNEGNRINFFAFMNENQDVLVRLRQDLEAIPANVPLHRFNRSEQLAYWLNLYNLGVLTQVSGIFPEERLKSHYFTDGEPGLWDQKIMSIAGVNLSLNDIHHKILIPKFKNPLIMYGLFQGVVGGPNIRDEAYTGRNVWEKLKANAREFVNSNRGVRIKDRIILASYFYEVNEALFPEFERNLKAHFYEYAKPHFADRLQKASSRISPRQTDWHIADLYGGNRSIASASVNPAALLNAFTGGGEGTEGYSGSADIAMGWANTVIEHNQSTTNFPIHMIQSLKKVHFKNKKLREGEVNVEEMADDETAADQAVAEPDNKPE